jgi:hypothetical protein
MKHPGGTLEMGADGGMGLGVLGDAEMKGLWIHGAARDK